MIRHGATGSLPLKKLILEKLTRLLRLQVCGVCEVVLYSPPGYCNCRSVCGIGVLLYFYSFLLSVYFSSMLFSVMAMSSGASSPSRPGGLDYALFKLDVHFHECEDYLDTEKFNGAPSTGDAKTIYDNCNELGHETSLKVPSHSWAHWGGGGAVLRNSKVRYFDKPSVRCEEECC